jgi:integrase/recombinase XerD
MRNINETSNFPTLLQQFFMERLIQQRNASPRTVASYRDTFRLFLQFGQQKLHKPPARFALADMDANLILAFLNYLEVQRHNTIRTRNARLAAIRSFLHHAALKEPSALQAIQSILAIPMKRFEHPLVGFLSREEIDALLGAPDTSTWCGQRDHVLFTVLYNTGARVSEIIDMRVQDIALDQSPSVRIHGKGRKERIVPLWRDTAIQLRHWVRRISSAPDRHLFPNRSGGPMSRTGVTDRLQLAAHTAERLCPQLKKRRISPHLIRHSTATHLLQAGVDLTVIALWLGHESPATTHIYVEADLAMKERALNTLKPPGRGPTRYRPTDKVLSFLDGL